jgi:hypothetical protein
LLFVQESSVYLSKSRFLTDQKWDRSTPNVKVKERNVNGTRTPRILQRGTSENVLMANEELGTCKLEGTNMQHVERSNGMKAAGVVGVNFQGEGAVQSDASNRTEVTSLQWDRWENELVRWEHDVDDRWDEFLLFGRQGPSERRFAERGFAELNLELKEIDRLTELIATERDATERRETAKRLAAERVTECVRKRAAERAADERDAMERRETAKRLAAERVADCDRKKAAERASAERMSVEVSVPQIGEKLAVEGAVVERVADARGVGHVIAERVDVDETSLEVSIIVKRAASENIAGDDDHEVGHNDAKPTDADQVVGHRSTPNAKRK